MKGEGGLHIVKIEGVVDGGWEKGRRSSDVQLVEFGLARSTFGSEKQRVYLEDFDRDPQRVRRASSKGIGK